MASIEYIVRATDAASGVFARIAASADGLDKQLGDLSKRIATPSVDLKDAKFTLGMLNAAKRLDKLSAMVAAPGVDVDTAKAQTEILRITAMLDRLDAKRVSVDVAVHRSVLSRLSFGALGGAAGGAAGAAGGAAQGAGGLAGGIFSNPVTATAAIAAGLASLPFIAQAAAGGITLALGGALSGIAILGAIKAKSVQNSFAGLAKTANADLVKIGRPFVPVLNSIAATAGKVLGGLAPVFKSAAQIMAGPFKLFADTLLKAFNQPAVATSIRAVASAFGAILKALAPQLGSDIRDIAIGITNIAQAVSKNPGAFAGFISFLFKIAGGALDIISSLTRVATWIEKHWNVIKWIVAPVVVAVVEVVKHWGTLRHQTAVIFDGARHDIAHVWDMIWNNTAGRVQRGVSDVIGWFKGLPGRVLGALTGLGHGLARFASAAMTEMWNGIKNVGSGILGWFGGFVGKIVGFFSRLLHHSPTGDFYFMGKNMMEGLAMGIKDHARLVGNAARFAVSGALGGDALANQSLARKIFPWDASQWAPFVRLVMAESGFNRFASRAGAAADEDAVRRAGRWRVPRGTAAVVDVQLHRRAVRQPCRRVGARTVRALVRQRPARRDLRPADPDRRRRARPRTGGHQPGRFPWRREHHRQRQRVAAGIPG